MMNSTEFQPLALRLLNARGWDNKMRMLVLASKQLPTLDTHLRVNDTLVKGCDSDVWLDCKDTEPTILYMAYSPSKVIRGVLAIILEQTNQLTPEAVVAFNFDEFCEKLALSRFLSQSRGNGLRKVIQRIKLLAER
ncbi:SufE family protein [Alteromonas sp. ASW11-130]|uniref:SufE family protein n=1 Tax=Alteromonas sp. ASW11-130 TaxID=3015775 RepID=UPI002241F924|nr:SufE family protein [Alteromonas sp. ASW11-130]MCW8090603.1 SufE family protein [Alteromonas sp. ASW11-130]